MSNLRTPLQTQKKHLTVVERQRREQQEASVMTSKDDLLKPPAMLVDAYAKNEWKRIIPLLIEIDIIGSLDMANIAGYCNAFAQYRRATDKLRTEPLVYDYMDEKTGFEMHKENPTLKVQARAAQEMRRFGDMCGMSISSRLKAAATKAKETDDQIENVFGVI